MYMQFDILKSLKQVRERAGFTQLEVESLLNMRKLSIRDYETGRLKLPISVAIELSRIYKVSLDQLVGMSILENESNDLVNFRSLFIGNNFNIMFFDPVIKGYLENHLSKFYQHSIFDLIVLTLNKSEQKKLILDIAKILFILAGSDGKILNNEIECIRSLLSSFSLKQQYKEISSNDKIDLLDIISNKSFEKLEIKHFVIWVLFLFSSSIRKVNNDEVKFIENIAEKIRMNRSNFIFIKDKFVKDQL